MDWIARAKQLFSVPKPEHFTDHPGCPECAEHDQTLRSHDADSIGMAELGNPGWDPLCFSSTEGLMYYTPAMVRLTLQSLDNDMYLELMLYRLNGNGPGNDFVRACNPEQRTFIRNFLGWLIEHHTDAIRDAMLEDDILRAHEIWSE